MAAIMLPLPPAWVMGGQPAARGSYLLLLFMVAVQLTTSQTSQKVVSFAPPMAGLVLWALVGGVGLILDQLEARGWCASFGPHATLRRHTIPATATPQASYPAC